MRHRRSEWKVKNYFFYFSPAAVFLPPFSPEPHVLCGALSVSLTHIKLHTHTNQHKSTGKHTKMRFTLRTVLNQHELIGWFLPGRAQLWRLKPEGFLQSADIRGRCGRHRALWFVHLHRRRTILNLRLLECQKTRRL